MSLDFPLPTNPTTTFLLLLLLIVQTSNPFLSTVVPPIPFPSSPAPTHGLSPLVPSPLSTHTQSVSNPSTSSTLPSLHSGLTPEYPASPTSPYSPVSPSLSPPAPPNLQQPSNLHPMVTRAKSRVSQVLLTHAGPRSPKEALAIPHWKEAMQQEFDALVKNTTWTLTELPPRRQAIGCKWVFSVKENPDGSINKFKARLVVKGFH